MAGVGQVTEAQRLRQKIQSAKIAQKKYKYNMGVYEPNASRVKADGSRADQKAFDLYNENKKHFDEISAEIADYQKKIDALEKAKVAETASSLKEDYFALRDQLDAAVDPNGATAKNIQKKMDAILAKYKEASGAKDILTAKADLEQDKLKAAYALKEGDKTPIEKGAEALNKTADAAKNKVVSSGNKVVAASKPVVNSGTPSAVSGTIKDVSSGVKSIDQVVKDAAGLGYGAIDTVFKTVPELTSLLTKAVTEKWTPARFQSELQNSTWFKSNATDLQQRGFYKRQYNDLISGIAAGDPDKQAKIDALAGSTEYGRGLSSVKRLIQAEAIAEGAVIDNAALDTLAQDIYDHALEKDGLAIRDYVRAQIKYNPGKVLSGKAGTDLADLKKTAAANGIDLDKAFGTSIQGWLQKLAAGESVDTYKNIIRQAAKIGLPDKVASLLDNGVDLQTIYDPYRNLMANTLEINPETITLSDPTLRSAITPTGETSLYDFAKQLRQDNRWQYTQQAGAEVGNAVQQVLKDFGFMG